jgi:transposase-like protein
MNFRFAFLEMRENDRKFTWRATSMECPECHGTHIRKNGHRQHKQNYICVKCGRQFLEHYESRGYRDDVMKQSGAQVPDSYDPKSIPQVGEGENTRLRHYLARLHRKTLGYSKSVERLKHSIRLLIHYLKFRDVPMPA